MALAINSYKVITGQKYTNGALRLILHYLILLDSEYYRKIFFKYF